MSTNMIRFKGVAAASLATLLVACGGGGDSAVSSVVPTMEASSRSLDGSVMKGPLQGATVQFFLVDDVTGAIGASVPGVSAVVSNGGFTVSGSLPNALVAAVATGGFFVDESDPNTSNPRKIAMTGPLKAVLPINATTFAITPLSMAVYEQALAQWTAQPNPKPYGFASIYSAVRSQAAQIYGLDVVTTIPASPSTGTGGNLRYGQLLGGVAQAINALAVNAQHYPTFADVTLFVQKLASGTLGSSGVNFSDEIRRFSGNNPQVYSGSPAPTVNESALTAPATPSNSQPTINALATTSYTFNQTQSVPLQTVALSGLSQGQTGAGQPEPGQTFTVSIASTNPALTPDLALNYTSGQSTGSVTFTPNTANPGTALVTITVKDSGGTANGGTDTATRTFSVTVSSFNNTPTISDVTDLATNEDTATAALPFTIGDVETAASSLTVTATSSDVLLVPSLVLGGSGANRTVTLTPGADLNGTATITLTVTDAGNAVATDTFVLTVNAVNDAPVAIDDTASTTEDTLVSIPTATLLGNDSDVDGPVLSIASVSNAAGGTAVLNGANVDFTPASNTSGIATFDYTITDGALTDAGTVTVTINAVTDPPVISGQNTLGTNEDTALTLTTGDFTITDPDSSSFTLTVGSGANYSVIGNTITPAAEFSGTLTVPVTVNDGASDSAVFNATVTVTAVNDAPTIQYYSGGNFPGGSFNEDNNTGGLDFTIADAETAVASLVVTVTSDNATLFPAGTAFDLTPDGDGLGNTDVTITPAADQYGTGNITITVDDGNSQTSTSFPLTVLPVSDAPTSAAFGVTTNEGSDYVFSLADFAFSDATDSNGDGSDVDSFDSVRVNSLASAGYLYYTDGVNEQQIATLPFPPISVTDILVGRFYFRPNAGESGTPYASFAFSVIDTGTTASGGVIESLPYVAEVNVTPAPPPANDNFADAQLLDISGGYTQASGVNNGATLESLETQPTCSGTGKTVWFKFVAPTAGRILVDTYGSGFDTVLGVYQGTDVTALSEEACNDEANIPGATSPLANNSEAGFNATASTTYYVQLGSYGNGVPADYSLTVGYDSDNDGLSDYREGLFGSNPNSADSDNDGHSDLEEVSQDGNRFDYVGAGTDTNPADSSDRPNFSVPVANADESYLSQGGTATTVGSDCLPCDVTVLANDTDDDGDLAFNPLQVAYVNGQPVSAFSPTFVPMAYGYMYMFADGTFSYTHDGSGHYTDSVDYIVTDGTYYSAPATLTFHVSPPFANAYFPVVKGDGALKLIDPRVPDQPIYVGDVSSNSGQRDQFRTLFAVSSVSSGVGSNPRPAQLLYIANGRIYRVSLVADDAGGYSPQQVSSITNACGFNGEAGDYINPLNSVLRVDTAGVDATCGNATGGGASADDEAFLIKADEDSGSPGVAIGLGDCCGISAIRDSGGNLTSVVTTEGNGTGIELRIRSVSSLGTVASNLATMQPLFGSAFALAEAGLGDQYVYVRGKRTAPSADSTIKLFRIDVALASLTEVYDYAPASDGSTFGDHLDEGAFDGTNFYFTHGYNLLKVPHNASGTGQAVVIAQATAPIDRVSQTSDRVIYEYHDATGSSGGVWSALKSATDNSTAQAVYSDNDNPRTVYLAGISYDRLYLNVLNSGAPSAITTNGAGSVLDTWNTGVWVGRTFGSQCNFTVGCEDTPEAAYWALYYPASMALYRIDPTAIPGSGGSLFGSLPVPSNYKVQVTGFGGFASITTSDPNGDEDTYFTYVDVPNANPPVVEIGAVTGVDDFWVIDGENDGVVDLNSDNDSDGLTYSDEVNVYGTDPNNPDTDGDGFQDGYEVSTSGTDPVNPDTDGDSFPDGSDPYPLDPNNNAATFNGTPIDGISVEMSSRTALPGFAIEDADAPVYSPAYQLVLEMSGSYGYPVFTAISVRTDVPGGIGPEDLQSANDSGFIVIQATLPQINATLAASDGVQILAAPTPRSGPQTLVATVQDLQGAGPGASPSQAVVFFNVDHFEIADTIGSNWLTRFNGTNSADGTGARTLGGGGDFNGDGIVDFVVGAQFAEPTGGFNRGAVYVNLGGRGVFRTPSDLASADPVQLGSALAGYDASNDSGAGFTVAGAGDHDGLGFTLAMGDLDNDGFDDLILGSQHSSISSTPNKGFVWVIFGGQSIPSMLDLASPGSVRVLKLTTGATNVRASRVEVVGDINGDGYVDLAVGAPGPLTGAGAVYVVFGGPSRLLTPSGCTAPCTYDMTGLDGSNGFRLDGAAGGDRLGLTLASLGDFNGDGFQDFAAGAQSADPDGSRIDAGQVYVYFGHGGSYAAATTITSLGSGGIVINGENPGTDFGDADSGNDTPGDSIGTVAGGDFDGDGKGDLVIGAQSADPLGRVEAGAIYVMYGAASYPSTYELSSLYSDSHGYVIVGQSQLDGSNYLTLADRLGGRLRAVGDMNRDGLDDFVFNGGTPPGDDTRGAVNVIFGNFVRKSGSHEWASLTQGVDGFRVLGYEAGSNLGDGIGGAGDLDGDGYGDLGLGAVGFDASQNPVHGTAYAVFGANFTDVADSDGDGLSNLYEQLRIGSSLEQSDTDGDGLDDRLEVRVFGTNPANEDSDGDGITDFDEVNRDGKPTDYNKVAGDTDPLDTGSGPVLGTYTFLDYDGTDGNNGASAIAARFGTLTFLPNGAYVVGERVDFTAAAQAGGACNATVSSEDTTAAVAAGMEYGRYSWNIGSGAFSVRPMYKETDGFCGFNEPESGSTNDVRFMNYDAATGILTFTWDDSTRTRYVRVGSHANTLRGSFLADGSVAAGEPIVFTFFPSGGDPNTGRYLMADANLDTFNPGPESAGIEYGCYTRNSSTGELTVDLNPGTCANAIDTNDEAGLSHPTSAVFLTFPDPDTVHFATGDGSGDLRRVSPEFGNFGGDVDGDGLDAAQEAALGTNPNRADTDNDGINDGAEVAGGSDPYAYEEGVDTDPTNFDTDGDGLVDGSDPAPLSAATVSGRGLPMRNTNGGTPLLRRIDIASGVQETTDSPVRQDNDRNYRSLYGATVNAATGDVSDIHIARLAYVSYEGGSGEFRVLNLETGATSAPAAGVTACGISEIAEDIANPDMGWLLVNGPGSDGRCFTNDDPQWGVRADASVVVPLVNFVRRMEPARAADGSLVAVLTLEAGNPYQLVRRDATTFAPSGTPRALGNDFMTSHEYAFSSMYLGFNQAGSTKLYRYDPVTDAATEIYTYSSEYPRSGGTYDATSFYFSDGGVLKKVDHASTTPLTLMVTSGEIGDINLTATKVLTEVDNGINGEIRAVPKAGGSDQSLLPVVAGTHYYLHHTDTQGTQVFVEKYASSFSYALTFKDDGSGLNSVADAIWGAGAAVTAFNIRNEDEPTSTGMIRSSFSVAGPVIESVNQGTGALVANLGTIDNHYGFNTVRAEGLGNYIGLSAIYYNANPGTVYYGGARTGDEDIWRADITAADSLTYAAGGAGNDQWLFFEDKEDRDDDGLMDSQEALLGTNRFSWDTDGDGYSDYEEVDQDGNPDAYTAANGDSDPLSSSSTPAVSSTALLGTWSPQDKIGLTVTFLPDGRYIKGGVENDSNCNEAGAETNGNGFEFGHYTFDGSNLLITDQIGQTDSTQCGLDSETGSPLSIAVINDGQSFTIGGGSPIHRVASGGSGSLVGAWAYAGSNPGAPIAINSQVTPVLVTFTADGHYTLLDTQPQTCSDGNNGGVESGSFSASGGNIFVSNLAVDTNGDCGFSNLIPVASPGTLTFDNPNQITIVSGSETVVFVRLTTFNPVDPDGDGVVNEHEYYYGTYANDPDTDNDGLNDGDEQRYGTNPHAIDTDGDGFQDGYEVAQGTDPNNSSDYPANPAPVPQSDFYAVAPSGTLTVPAPGLLANDNTNGGAGITIGSYSSMSGLVVNSNGSFSYDAGASPGQVTFTYSVTDGSSSYGPVTVYINVTSSTASAIPSFWYMPYHVQSTQGGGDFLVKSDNFAAVGAVTPTGFLNAPLAYLPRTLGKVWFNGDTSINRFLYDTLVYMKGGQLFWSGLRDIDSPSVQTRFSSETGATYADACDAGAVPLAYEAGATRAGLYLYRLRGADNTCDTSDDVQKAARTSDTVGTAPTTIAGKVFGQIYDTDANASLKGFLVLRSDGSVDAVNTSFTTVSSVLGSGSGTIDAGAFDNVGSRLMFATLDSADDIYLRILQNDSGTPGPQYSVYTFNQSAGYDLDDVIRDGNYFFVLLKKTSAPVGGKVIRIPVTAVDDTQSTEIYTATSGKFIDHIKLSTNYVVIEERADYNYSTPATLVGVPKAGGSNVTYTTTLWNNFFPANGKVFFSDRTSGGVYTARYADENGDNPGDFGTNSNFVGDVFKDVGTFNPFTLTDDASHVFLMTNFTDRGMYNSFGTGSAQLKYVNTQGPLTPSVSLAPAFTASDDSRYLYISADQPGLSLGEACKYDTPKECDVVAVDVQTNRFARITTTPSYNEGDVDEDDANADGNN